MSHSQKPHMPSQPANIQPTPSEEVAQKLDQILHAIMPLHDLLQEQEKSEQTLTERLTEVMEDLGLAAASLQTSAVALKQIAEADRVTPAQQTEFDYLNARHDQMEKQLNTLSNWLGAPMGSSAEPTSSATS